MGTFKIYLKSTFVFTLILGAISYYYKSLYYYKDNILLETNPLAIRIAILIGAALVLAFFWLIILSIAGRIKQKMQDNEHAAANEFTDSASTYGSDKDKTADPYADFRNQNK